MATEETQVDEKMRTYHWFMPGNLAPQMRMFAGIATVRVSDSGTHYLKDMMGGLHIIAPGWSYIDITPATPDTGWTF